MTDAARLSPPFGEDDAYPRFSHAEYTRRHTAVRMLLEEHDAMAAIVAGHAASRNELQYLTNAPVRWESFLVLPMEGEPRLFIQLFNHVPNMTAWSSVPTEWAGTDPVATVGGHLEASGLARGRIGLLGPVSHRTGERLAKAMPHASFVSLEPAFTRLRLVKQAEEIAWTRYAAALCDAAVEGFVHQARPGMREDELAHLLDAGHARLGGQTGICFLATASMSEGGAVVPAQVPSRRAVHRGDLALFELSAGVGGYTSQILRTVAIGADPPIHIRRLHDLAEMVLERIVEDVRPGVTAAEIESHGAIIDDASLTIVDDLVHGYGGGYLPPVVRTPATRLMQPPDLELRPGMFLVVQPNVVSADRRYGVQTGELVVVTEDGAERLHRAPRGILRAD